MGLVVVGFHGLMPVTQGRFEVGGCGAVGGRLSRADARGTGAG